jgi:ATP-binding cassette subfamily F protein 3
MRAHARQAEEIAKTEEFIRRYGAGQRSKEARGRGKKLARVERIEAPTQSTRHSWGLEAADLGSETVLETTALAVGYGDPVMRTGPLRVPRDARVACRRSERRRQDDAGAHPGGRSESAGWVRERRPGRAGRVSRAGAGRAHR